MREYASSSALKSPKALSIPAAAIQAPSQGPTSVAASAGQAPSVQWRQSVSASTGTIVTR